MSTQNNTLPDNPQIEVIKSGKTGLFTNYIYKAIPLAFDESMSYYETLCGLLNYLKNVILPTVNNNADAVSELQTLYEELRTYVDDYFKNLDVQEEINNKLDDMVEKGTLQEIIASYLNSKALFGYDNVDDMKNATNLINGSYAETLGYYNKNDGGHALYKIREITNEDVVDEMFIIGLNNDLIAELIIENSINIKQIGAYGDINHDDTIYFNAIKNIKKEIIIPDGKYKINDTINFSSNINLKCYGTIVYSGSRNKSVLIFNGKCNNIILYDIVDINSINNIDYDGGWHGWEDERYCAIELIDFSYSNINFNKIANFTTGLIVNGSTIAGTFKSNITGYQIFNCKIGLCFESYPNTWVNNCSINKIMINYGSNSEFRTSSNPITSYGFYQKNIENDKYGIQYITFNNLFFETAYKDNFIGFYFNLIKRCEFNKCIPEIKSGTTYALFDMKYPIEQDVSPVNHSHNNTFNYCPFMAGNNNLTFNNTGRALCSLPEIAKHNDIKYNLVYKENNLLGKMVKIDNNHMSIKGYAFAKITAESDNINTCQLEKSDYSPITNQYEQNCLSIGSITPLSLIIPCNLNDTFKIVLNENGATSQFAGNMQFKCFNSNGDLLDPVDENNNKKLSGLFSNNNNTKNLVALSIPLNNIEFSVIDQNVKYILVYIYNYVNGFTIYKQGNPSIIKKFGNNLKHLYLLGDVAFSNTKPISTADTDSVIKNQRVYNSNVNNIGEYWTFDGTSWN